MSFFKTEKEFEDQFFAYVVAHKLNPVNHREVVGAMRQVNLGYYGVADVVLIENHGSKTVYNVVELKNVPFASGMIFQVCRYMEAVKLGVNYNLVKNFKLDFFDSPVEVMDCDAKVIGSLVCPGNADLTKNMVSAFNALSIDVYSVNMELLSLVFESEELNKFCSSDEIEKIQATLKQVKQNITWDI
jgi:hypothetical protein